MYMNTDTPDSKLPSFAEAADAIKARGNGDLLKGMEDMADLITDYHAGKLGYDWDADFIWDWCYELDCFKVVYVNMSKLFN